MSGEELFEADSVDGNGAQLPVEIGTGPTSIFLMQQEQLAPQKELAMAFARHLLGLAKDTQRYSREKTVLMVVVVMVCVDTVVAVIVRDEVVAVAVITQGP